MTTPAYAFEVGEHLPSESVQASAGKLRDLLTAQIEGDSDVELTAVGEADGEQHLVLDPALSRLLVQLLGHLQKGDGVTFVPISKQLTTQQAADILNVSRPFLIKLLEGGEIAFDKVGRHRRIRAQDLFAYKRRRETERTAAMEELLAGDGDLY
jgi:excisionase family DNA binding protein